MSTTQNRLGSFLIGLYGWVLAIFFGMVCLDILFARLVPEAAMAFSEVADLLLMIGFVMLLAAIAAIAFSWTSKTARNLLIASLFGILFEFFGPAFFSQFLRNTQELTIGPWLRIIPSGAASILAFMGMVQYYRQK